MTLPLQGVRVADFGQIIAAPFAAQLLGWLGAEVVLVETEERMTTRVWPPFADGQPGINRSGGFNLVNANKLSCTLNLRDARGLELAKGLIAVSDIVMENFSSGAMERMGLGYETVRAIRPDVIYVSLGAFGRTGPFKDLTGFHSVVNLFSGLAAVTGHPGTHPRIMGGLFPDAFSGCYCVLAILEALYHRARTGEGQYIEVSMTEALAGLIPEAVMEYSMTGREQELVGNRHPEKAPHNVFRCLGDEKWVAISVESNVQFRALAQVSGHPEWADDPRFATIETRLTNQDELEGLVQAWAARREAAGLAALLQEAGVPAAPVWDTREVLADPHLVDRGFVTQVDHPETGPRPMPVMAWSVDGSRKGPFRRAPLLGEHNRYVIQELLQVPDAEYDRLVRSGVIR